MAGDASAGGKGKVATEKKVAVVDAVANTIAAGAAIIDPPTAPVAGIVAKAGGALFAHAIRQDDKDGKGEAPPSTKEASAQPTSVASASQPTAQPASATPAAQPQTQQQPAPAAAQPVIVVNNRDSQPPAARPEVRVQLVEKPASSAPGVVQQLLNERAVWQFGVICVVLAFASAVYADYAWSSAAAA